MTKPLLSILLLLPLSVSAEQCREQTLPTEKALPLQGDIAAQEDLILLTNGWPMVGETRLKVMFWELYDAQLFRERGAPVTATRWNGKAHLPGEQAKKIVAAVTMTQDKTFARV
jgi:hypothetical protein